MDRGAGLLGEVEAKTLFKAYGIPVNRTEVAKTTEEAVEWARRIGYPVVMKVFSRDLSHKSDVGGVKLNLRSERNVRDAFSEIMDNVHRVRPEADIDGITIQSMIPRPDYELILGSKRDPDFGPVILFGMGGIMTEILRDQAVALPPLNRLLARRLMESTRVYQILKGYRNHPPAKIEMLEEILIRLSHLVTDFPEITELDINPLILAEDQACAIDARVFLQPSERPSPLHLVISPYPDQYEKAMTTKGGMEIFTRPIKPEDAPLLEELFRVLSKQSIYFRFFGPMKSLPPRMLAYFTQIDYDRDIAIVALDRSAGHEKMLGVARLMGDPDGIRAELAVLVGDPWQGRGIGAALMSRLIAISKDRGIKSIWGLVLAENTHMLSLASKAGFQSIWNKEQRAYELKAEVDAIPNHVWEKEASASEAHNTHLRS
jgi:acetyltransferase